MEMVNVALCASSGDVVSPPENWVVWIDICDEPALSRLCVAPKNIFALPVNCEDERLANGEVSICSMLFWI